MRLVVLFLFCGVATMAQELQKGVVVPSIQLENSEKNTYAVYLPKSYNEDKKYPVVFVFDAQGKGAQAAQRFSVGANLTQSVIVAPNYVFSDSLNITIQQSSKLINTIFQSYAVDKDKIILAGEGKGALVASTNGHLSEEIAGVIAINDVFVDETILRKSSKAQFVILNKDTGRHFYKLKSYDRLYSFREKLKGYYEFESEDVWPDAGYLFAAMVDLLKGTASQEMLQKYYESELDFATSLYKRRRHIEAFEFVSDIKKQYKKSVDLKGQKELLREIRGNRTYRARRLQRNEAVLEEQLLLEDFVFFLNEDVKKAYFDNLGWWNYQMEELDTTIDSTAQNIEQRKGAMRLKMYVQGKVEDNYEFYAKNNASLEQLLFINTLRTLVQPDNQEAFINVISLSAKEGDTNAALFYLEELLRSGYTDYEALYEIDYTTAIRIGEEWNTIVKAYLGKSKYYNN